MRDDAYQEPLSATKSKKMKYIIFDIDGTLTNTTDIDDKCYIESFGKYFNVSIKDISWNQLKNVTDWGITEELIELKCKKKSTKPDIENLNKLFLKRIKDEFKINKSNFNEIQGATKFYNFVKSEPELKIGIATGGWEETATFKLNAIGINPNEVCFSNSSQFKKREDITLDVIKQLNSKYYENPDEIIYFGDGEWDLRTCKNLNIRFIGIDNNNTGKLSKIGAKEVFQDYKKPNIIMNSIKSSSR